MNVVGIGSSRKRAPERERLAQLRRRALVRLLAEAETGALEGYFRTLAEIDGAAQALGRAS